MPVLSRKIVQSLKGELWYETKVEKGNQIFGYSEIISKKKAQMLCKRFSINIVKHRKKIKTVSRGTAKKSKSAKKKPAEIGPHSAYQKHKYLYVHDNGGRPFLVFYNNKSVAVFKSTKVGRKKNDYKILVKVWTDIKKIFVPHRRVTLPATKYAKKLTVPDKGTVLVDLGKCRYVLIAQTIFEFQANGTILHFGSPILGSDVPRPYAYTKETAYLFLNGLQMPRSIFPNDTPWDSYIYDVFYDELSTKDGLKKYKTKMKKLSKIKQVSARQVGRRHV